MPLLNGTQAAASVRAALAERVKTQGLHPTLCVLLVGEDPASALYVSLKERAAREIGAELRVHAVPGISTDAACELIHSWNENPAVHGILVQLPLPSSVDTDGVIAAIDPRKDVDSFHPENRAALLRGEGTIFSPVHLAVLHLLAQSPLRIHGAHVLILAKSAVFSEPLAHLLKTAGAHVESHATLPASLNMFNAVITALGTLHLLQGPALHPEAVIIDISTNPTPNGRAQGDFDGDTLLETQYASPVPGGVGPLTIAFLLQNLVEITEQLGNRSESLGSYSTDSPTA